MILVLFCVWEDAKVWAHWNYSLDMHLNSLGLVSCLFPSWILLWVHSVGVRWRGGGDALMVMMGNIHSLLEWQATFFCLHSHNNNNNEHRLGGYTTKLGFSYFWSLENPWSKYWQIWCLVRALSIGCSQPLFHCIFLWSFLGVYTWTNPLAPLSFFLKGHSFYQIRILLSWLNLTLNTS